MPKSISSFLLLLWVSCSSQNHENSPPKQTSDIQTILKSGDIVFQNSQSNQCKAIELATHSKYTHCGIIFWKNRKCYVLEAVQPVRYTLFEDWIGRGPNSQYAVKRLKDQTILSDTILIVMQKTGEQYLGKDYDIYFGWGNDAIYCSELVWKIYKKAAGLEVGSLHKLKDFDLTSKEVKRIMKQRYGNNIPLEEAVVSPSNIFESALLETISE
jgi:uncharacterized protein YycO